MFSNSLTLMCPSLISIMALLIYKFCFDILWNKCSCESMFMVSHKTYFCYTGTVISMPRALHNMMLCFYQTAQSCVVTTMILSKFTHYHQKIPDRATLNKLTACLVFTTLIPSRSLLNEATTTFGTCSYVSISTSQVR